MNKESVANFFKGFQRTAVKRSPEILTGIGIAGMITTTVLAVKATPKALRLIEEKKEELDTDKLTVGETVKAAWKPYVPATVVGLTSVGCLIGASTVNYKRNAALATAYQLTTTAFNEYREKVVETIGEKKEKVVHENIAKERLEQQPVTKSQVILSEKGNTLCYDTLSDRYFKSDKGKIERSINELNRKMVTGMEMYVSLNEFYNEIGLPSVPFGSDIGWRVDRGMIDIHFTAELTDDDTPCIVLGYLIPPERDFDKLY